jgi:hypothetical protein
MGRRRTTQKLDEICSDTHFLKGKSKRLRQLQRVQPAKHWLQNLC